ncbi:hypothetical protein CRUP_009573 [Coryphaenoides rupestris]|nr:hypothetical protein CRUP_009573 [Coryphaenoides rupestris]
MSGTAESNKRVRCPSPGGASPADKRAKVETSGAKRRRPSSPKPTPACGKRRRTDVTSLTVGRPAGIQDLPPEIMEVIMGHLSPQDLTSLGATCSRFHQQIQNRWVWRRVCGRMRLDHLDPGDWRRMAILKDTQALHVHQLVKRPRRPSTSRAVDIPLSTGYRRVVPISDGVLLLDYQRTLHILRRDGSAGALGRPTTFCHDVKDFAVDPCSNTSYRGLVYVVHGTRHPCVGSCEVIVYLLANGRCISHSMFDASLDFVQIRLTGTEKDRCLQILTADEDVLEVSLDEDRLHRPHNHELSISFKAFTDFEGPQSFQQVVTGWVGSSHICLVDERGDLYTQGDNRYGQLGSGDRVDRGQLTRVAVPVSLCPVGRVVRPPPHPGPAADRVRGPGAARLRLWSRRPTYSPDVLNSGAFNVFWQMACDIALLHKAPLPPLPPPPQAPLPPPPPQAPLP